LRHHLQVQLPGSLAGRGQASDSTGGARVVKGDHPAKLRYDLAQDFEPFRSEIIGQEVEAGQPCAGLCNALDEPGRDWVSSGREHNGDVGGGPLHRASRGRPYRDDHVDLLVVL